MSARERFLATMVGIAVVVLIGYLGVNNLVIQPRAALNAEIAKDKAEVAKLEKTLRTLPVWREEWQAMTGDTLGSDEHEVQSEFRDDLLSLLIEAGFREPDLQPPTVQWHPHFRDAGFREVSVKVDVEGELAKLERFLRAFYQRPYYNGIRRVTIDAPEPKRRRGETGPLPEPMLDISLTATTLVLPKVLDIEPVAFNNDPNTIDARLARPLSAYELLASNNPFKKYEPPRPKPDPKPEPKPDSKPEPVKVVENPPPPPPPNKTLVGVVAIEGRYYGYVRNDDNLAVEPAEVQIGDVVDGGRVLLIHPRGLVVRAPEVRGKEDVPTVDYFYPLGQPFAERQTLDPQTQPRVYEVFARVYGAES